jgi:DnaJ-domain-containing protein 1
VFLGSREDTAHIGYVQGQCPKCRNVGMFTVFQAKRRLTLYGFAGVPLSEQQILECRSCGVKFAIPPEMREQLQSRMISADRLADLAGQLPMATGEQENGKDPGQTLYQIMQVDPYADPEVIEAAFKRLAFKYHPDRSTAPDAAARMRELITVRDVLTNPLKRKQYDRQIGIKPRVVRTTALRPEEV